MYLTGGIYAAQQFHFWSFNGRNVNLLSAEGEIETDVWHILISSGLQWELSSQLHSQ